MPDRPGNWFSRRSNDGAMVDGGGIENQKIGICAHLWRAWVRFGLIWFYPAIEFVSFRNMKMSRNLGLAAVVVFVISHFLPAYGDGSGFACFEVCWKMLLGHDSKIFSGSWFYYSGFAISNILFVGLVVALFVTKKSRRLRSVVSVVFFLHVLSWFVLHVAQRPPEISEIKIGYYVWLIAYGLLAGSNLWKDSDEALGSIPLAPSVV
jgi:hypothetical protein